MEKISLDKCYSDHLTYLLIRLEILKVKFALKNILPSSAQAPAQLGLSWLYSQLIQLQALASRFLAVAHKASSFSRSWLSR